MVISETALTPPLSLSHLHSSDFGGSWLRHPSAIPSAPWAGLVENPISPSAPTIPTHPSFLGFSPLTRLDRIKVMCSCPLMKLRELLCRRQIDVKKKTVFLPVSQAPRELVTFFETPIFFVAPLCPGDCRLCSCVGGCDGPNKKKKKKETDNTSSESMGSDAHLHRMQPWCRRLLPSLLFPLPSFITETPQIRHLVSSPLNYHHEASIFPDMLRPRRNANVCLPAAVLHSSCSKWLRGMRQLSLIRDANASHSIVSELTGLRQPIADGLWARCCSSSHGQSSWDLWFTLNIWSRDPDYPLRQPILDRFR